MKRKLQQLTALVLVLILAFVPSTMGYGADMSAVHEDEGFDAFHNELVEEFGEEFATNYHQAMQALHLLYDTFPRNRMGEAMYPDYFGGMYIDKFGNANVLIVRTSEVSDSALLDVREQGANVRYVEFSFDELWSVIHYIAVL